MKDDNGASYFLNYNTPTTTGASSLGQDHQDKLEQVLFLLDKFCVGDEVYHELSYESDDLPKSYLVKQLRAKMNKTYIVERTVGEYPGAKLNFTSTLTDHVQELLQHKPELSTSTIQVELSGDGASMSRSTNFMMMSFSLLQWDEKVMSSKNNRTVAVVNGPEDYHTLKVSLSSLFNEVNELIKTGSMLINGERVKLEFFLGGDLKFLLMVMGMNGASSNYACLWCLLHKDEQWDTSKDLLYYNETPKCRTLENIKKLYQSKSNNLGCINKPLLDIALDHVVPDELHLLLRVTDRLLENIIEEVMEKDSVNDFNKPKGHPKGVGLTNLVKAINDCGVPFKV